MHSVLFLLSLLYTLSVDNSELLYVLPVSGAGSVIKKKLNSNLFIGVTWLYFSAIWEESQVCMQLLIRNFWYDARGEIHGDCLINLNFNLKSMLKVCFTS